MSIFPPSNGNSVKPIVFNLNLSLVKGTNTLICGRGHCGKTSILRAIKGLWPTGKDELWVSDYIKANPKSVMYLPNKPLLTLGSLRWQLIYPETTTNHDECSDDQIFK